MCFCMFLRLEKQQSIFIKCLQYCIALITYSDKLCSKDTIPFSIENVTKTEKDKFFKLTFLQSRSKDFTVCLEMNIQPFRFSFFLSKAILLLFTLLYVNVCDGRTICRSTKVTMGFDSKLKRKQANWMNFLSFSDTVVKNEFEFCVHTASCSCSLRCMRIPG